MISKSNGKSWIPLHFFAKWLIFNNYFKRYKYDAPTFKPQMPIIESASPHPVLQKYAHCFVRLLLKKYMYPAA